MKRKINKHPKTILIGSEAIVFIALYFMCNTLLYQVGIMHDVSETISFNVSGILAMCVYIFVFFWLLRNN